MPRWDYVCPRCGLKVALTFRDAQARDKWEEVLVCDDPCLTKLERQPSAPSFMVTGYNAANGYSK